MKKLIPLAVILFLYSCGNAGKTTENQEQVPKVDRPVPQNKTIEEFGEQIFKYIQKDSYSQILDLMPELEEYKAVIKNSSLTEQKKDRALKTLENDLKDDIRSLKSSYSDLVKNAERAGVDWSKTKLEYIDYIHVKADKIEVAEIYLNFSFKGVNYKIELNECVKIGDSWLMGSKMNWINPAYDYGSYEEEWYKR